MWATPWPGRGPPHAVFPDFTHPQGALALARLSRIRRALLHWQGSLASAGRFRVGRTLAHPQGVLASAGLLRIRGTLARQPRRRRRLGDFTAL
ncbi:hypothetical protein HMPREF0972_00196 [Actinomyces sp. oral taxon 848 str. F0332]|nr:hypothetical protein HMPREF0972_00196 [Actinomyces sp. oral taxon 848 str. F0332]